MRIGILKYFFVFFFLFYSLNSFGELMEGYSVNLQVLDKITSKIKNLEIKVNDNYDYESIKIEIYSCYKRPPEEIPEDFVLLKIFDKLKKDETSKIFQGWMISSSPSSSPLEHPIYDVWIEECIVE